MMVAFKPILVLHGLVEAPCIYVIGVLLEFVIDDLYRQGVASKISNILVSTQNPEAESNLFSRLAKSDPR
jgi:hypothetical protein